MQVVNQVKNMTIGDFQPDMTFLIDVPVDHAFARIENRDSNNRYEKMGRDFHCKVRDGFLKLNEENERIRLIDGTRSPQAIFEEIATILGLD